MSLPAHWSKSGVPFFRQAIRLAGFSALIVLANCSPIETYRSMAGLQKNDPDETALFSNNLAEAEKEPYPNLASVPPPPTRGMSAAERQKLAASLAADRSATTAAAGPPPPAPPPAPPAAAPAKTAAAQAGPGGVTPSVPTTAPATKGSTVAGAAPADAVPAAASPPNVTPLPPPAANAAALPDSAKAATVVAAATTPAGDHGKSRDPTKAGANSEQNRRKPGEPPEPGPQDSTMKMPEVHSTPEPEATRPPPPRPYTGPATSVASLASPLPPAADMTPAPPPEVPVLPPVPPPPAIAKAETKGLNPTPAVTTVATLDVAGGSSALSSEDRAAVERIAGQYKETPHNLRVVARAAAPTDGSDPLASFHAALGRAQAVAAALTAAGIPAAKIQTEATPAGGVGNPGRVEIQFAP
ncbi:MAG TPA: hypothetical protein VHY35_19290 [Stellaceae bacterium]|nr:hypothetical protein [Stellaceae bacterium]